MHGWQGDVAAFLHLLFGKAGGHLFVLQMGLAVLVYIGAFSLVAGTFDFGRTGRGPVLGSACLALVVLVAAGAAAGHWGKLPGVPAAWTLPGILLAVWLAVVLPLHCLLLKSNYARAAIAMIISVAAATLATYFFRTVTTAVTEGGRVVSPERAYRRSVEKVLNDKDR